MQIKQSFEVESPLSDVWRAFTKPEQLVSCLPGASLDKESTADDLSLLFKVKLGPITANFAGKGSVTFNDEDHTGVFEGSAIDRKSNSRVKGQAQFALSEAAPARTTATIDVSFSITGSLAQFSRESLVRSLADQLTQQFASNLQKVLQQSGTLPASERKTELATQDKPTQSTSPEPKSLSVMSLLWGALKQWLRSLFGRSASR